MEEKEKLERATGWESPKLTSLLAFRARAKREEQILAVLEDYSEGLTAREIAEVLTAVTGKTVEAGWISLTTLERSGRVRPAGYRHNGTTGAAATVYILNAAWKPIDISDLEEELKEAQARVREIRGRINERLRTGGGRPKKPPAREEDDGVDWAAFGLK